MVLDGVILEEQEFKSTFRMTQNSFNQLHALLGIQHSCTNVEPYITLIDTHYRAATPSQVRLMVFLYHATQGTKPCQGFIANVTSYVSEVGVRVLRECYDEGGDRRRG